MKYIITVILSFIGMILNFENFPNPLSIFCASFCGVSFFLAVYFLEIDRREIDKVIRKAKEKFKK